MLVGMGFVVALLQLMPAATSPFGLYPSGQPAQARCWLQLLFDFTGIFPKLLLSFAVPAVSFALDEGSGSGGVEEGGNGQGIAQQLLVTTATVLPWLLHQVSSSEEEKCGFCSL